MLNAVRSRLTYANVVATGALFVALGGGAYALSGIPDRGGLFHGCVSNATGLLRVVKSASSCQRPKTIRRKGKRVRLPGEFAVAWNQQGRQGIQGQAGSNATVNGVPAGGDLTGTFPAPSVAARAVGPNKLARLPMVRARGTANFTVHNNTTTVIPFTGTPVSGLDFDTDGMHDPTGAHPERLTVRTPGTYLVYVLMVWDPNATGTRELRLQQHGTGDEDTEVSLLPGSGEGQEAVRMMHLEAGDFVTVAARQNSGGDLNVFPLDFGAAWLGP